MNRLKEYRVRVKLSQQAVAAALAALHGGHLGIDGNAVSRHERGQYPIPLYRALYCRLYRATEEDLWPTLVTLERPYGGTADHLAELVRDLRIADDTAPTGSLLPTSRALLQLAERLTADARLGDQRSIGRVAAEAAVMHWWLTVDAGLDPRAAHDKAMTLAVEFGVMPLVGHLLGWRAGLALSKGDYPTAIRLARESRRPDFGISAGGEAWATAYEMRARILLGETDAEPVLDAVRTAYAEVDPDGEPPWLYWLSGNILELDRLDMELFSGLDAIPAMERALARLPRERVRDAAWYRAHIAAARARAGDITAAVDDAARAAELSLRTGTSWTLNELRQLGRRPELALIGEALRDIR